MQLSNLTRVEQIANFLFEFIYGTKAFRCYLGGYYKKENVVTYITQTGDVEPCFLEWTKDCYSDCVGSYMGGIISTAASDNYVLTVEKVIAKLQTMDSITFTFSPLGELSG